MTDAYDHFADSGMAILWHDKVQQPIRSMGIAISRKTSDGYVEDWLIYAYILIVHVCSGVCI